MSIRSSLLTTLLLVLVALSGAGLAVAADREQTSFQRPELTWAADHAAQAYIAPVLTDLTAINTDASQLAKAGRDTLGNLQALNLDAVRAALADGDAAAGRISAALPGLAADHDAVGANVETWRLGPDTGAQVDAIDAAVASAPTLPQAWSGVGSRAIAVAGLVGDLQSHDSSVFQATTAARQGNWSDALTALAAAGTALNSAQIQGTALGLMSGADTLDQLVKRYADYDAALTALYGYMSGGGMQSGTQFDALNKAVEDTQAALPGNSGAYSLIVGEAGGTAISDELVRIEQARGDVNDALQPARE